MKKFGDMSTSELDKLLVKYVMSGESFLSDKELEATKELANQIMKEYMPDEDPKEIEKSNERFIKLLKDEQAHRKLEKLLKDKPQHIPEPVVGPNARRVIIGGETDPIHLQKSTASDEVTRYDAVGPYCLEKKKIEWKSEIGSKFEEGYVIKSHIKPPYPVMTREEVRKFAQYILNVTAETNYRG